MIRQLDVQIPGGHWRDLRDQAGMPIKNKEEEEELS